MEQHSAKSGVLLGGAAIVAWSVSSAMIVLGIEHCGVWQFITLSCLFSGALQVPLYALVMKKNVRQVLLLSSRMWLLAGLGFVLYLIALNVALAIASGTQKLGVNLMNFLWPTLTVVFAVLLVPGTKVTWRLGASTALALAGLGVACWGDVVRVFGGGAASSGALGLVPYALGVVAAGAWALYSTLVARWRGEARNYATSPAGFLATAAVAAAITTALGQWRAIDGPAWIALIIYSVMTGALGYMFWELALHRAPARILGLMGAATPILSTLMLILTMAVFPLVGQARSPDYANLMLGAAMVAGGVIVSVLPTKYKE